MKKTEKIEIRVSPEEKEALSAASRSEGRNVSDVLREQVRSYIAAAASAASPSTIERKKMTWISKAAYVALGAVLTAPATVFAVASNNPTAPGFEVLVALEERSDEQKSVQYRGLTRIPIGRSDPTLLTITAGEAGGYDVRIVKKPGADKTHHFVFDICRKTEDACQSVATPAIITSFGGESSLAVDGGDTDIYINIASREN